MGFHNRLTRMASSRSLRLSSFGRGHGGKEEGEPMVRSEDMATSKLRRTISTVTLRMQMLRAKAMGRKGMQPHDWNGLPVPTIQLSPPTSLPLLQSVHAPTPPPLSPLPPLPLSRTAYEGERRSQESARTASPTPTKRKQTPSMQSLGLQDSFESLLYTLDHIYHLRGPRGGRRRHTLSSNCASFDSAATKHVGSDKKTGQTLIVEDAPATACKVDKGAPAMLSSTYRVSLTASLFSCTPTMDGNNDDVLDLFTTLDDKTEILGHAERGKTLRPVQAIPPPAYRSDAANRLPGRRLCFEFPLPNLARIAQ